jgi:hypothetical protein
LKIATGFAATGNEANLERTEASILRIDSMSAFTELADGADLVIFDLDKTVFEFPQSFGSGRWFEVEMALAPPSGPAREDAVREIRRIGDLATHGKTHVPVEPFTVDLIRRLQRDGKTVMALTARRPVQAEETFRILKAIGIDFASSAPAHSPADSTLALYRNGVGFTAGTAKGPMLVEFLRAANLRPKSVAFVDDKQKEVLSVISALSQGGIPARGAVYTGADRLFPFDAGIARVQRAALAADQRVPSDEELRRRGRRGFVCDSIFVD